MVRKNDFCINNIHKYLLWAIFVIVPFRLITNLLLIFMKQILFLKLSIYFDKIHLDSDSILIRQIFPLLTVFGPDLS